MGLVFDLHTIVCQLFAHCRLNKAVQTLIVRHGVDRSIAVEFGSKSDVQTSFICDFRFSAFIPA